MRDFVPALPEGQTWVAVSYFGERMHVANSRGMRTHCGRGLMLPGDAGAQAVGAPDDLQDVCRGCASRVLPLAQALDLL